MLLLLSSKTRNDHEELGEVETIASSYNFMFFRPQNFTKQPVEYGGETYSYKLEFKKDNNNKEEIITDLIDWMSKPGPKQ